MTAEELRAQAKELYRQADTLADATERLSVVLRALELEADADELEREQQATGQRATK